MKSGVKRFTFGAMSAMLSAAIVLAGCSSAAPKTESPTDNKGPVIGGTLIDTEIGDAKTINPIIDADNASSHVSGFIFDGLLYRDEKLGYLPALAEKYSIDQDKIYTFNLKQGVKFHDGQELTADDVLFTFFAIAHPKYQGVRFDSFMGIKGWEDLGKQYDAIREDLKNKKIDDKTADDKMMAAYNNFVKTGGLTAPDKYTVRVELSQPYAPFLNDFTGYGILPKHLYEACLSDMKGCAQGKKPVGTGAYKFVDWVKDDHITLQRNPDWKYGLHQKAANVDKIVVKVVPDSQANMVALETHETDLANIQADNYDHFKNDVKDVTMKEYMAFTYTYLGYNFKNPMFSDAKVRRALTMAIDRKQIVDQLLKGHGAVADTHSSPARWDYNDKVQPVPFDVAGAEKLLDEAGWKKGPDGIREKNGQKFSFEIATNNGNKLREQSAVIIQQALKKVGVEVKVNLMEWNAFLDYQDSDKVQAYILGWSLGFDPDAYSIFHTKGGFNTHGYSNPKVDQVIEQAKITTDQAKRKELYGQMQQYLADDQVYTWLYYPTSIYGFSNRIQGLPKDLNPNGPFWNLEDWTLSDARSAK